MPPSSLERVPGNLVPATERIAGIAQRAWAWRLMGKPGNGWRRCVLDFHGRPVPFDSLVAPPLTFPASPYLEL
jgi:hypothetical protein